jgi:hypothetical protein
MKNDAHSQQTVPGNNDGEGNDDDLLSASVHHNFLLG